jgi:hypothetical protein
MNIRLERHLFGLASELLFELECEARGLRVCRPISDQTAVDRVLIRDSGCYAVQIKSVRWLSKDRRPCGKVRERYVVDNKRRNGERFPLCLVSFMAVYVGPLNRWHIFEAGEHTGKRIRIPVDPKGWCVMR